MSDFSRRSLLRAGLGGTAAAATLATLGNGTGLAMAAGAEQSRDSSSAMATAGNILPFHGLHQMGVVNPPPAAAILASFTVLGTARKDLDRLFKVLTERAEFLMSGGTPPAFDPKFPPADSGILGPRIVPENVSVTVAVGNSLFDDRFGLKKLKPAHLQTMTRFPNDALDATMCHGDVLVQICADSQGSCIHALRDIIKYTPDLLTLRWKIDGFLPAQPSDRPRETPRNLFGFKDGTANPDTEDSALMDKLIWVQKGDKEPDWAAGGTYQAVRLIRHFLERWDRTPLQEQEAIFGRDRDSGAPIGMKGEHDEPDYKSDPEGKKIRLDSHMRLANPRDGESDKHRILRRAFNYSRGITKSGQLDMGLAFICFQRDLDAGFIYVQNRLNGEPFEEYIKPFGGGYFFVLPGVSDPSDYFGQALLKSA